MSTIENNITAVQRRLQQAASDAGRNPADIRLLAVTKTRNCSQISRAMDAGVSCFGENYLQEAMDKMEQLRDKPLEWHFIGPLQSNKTRQAAENFAWIHAIDRLKIAQRLSAQRPDNLPALNICLQINIDNESSKSGFNQDQAMDVAATIAQLPNLKLRGLMAIPKPRSTHMEQRQPFAQLRNLMQQINSELDNSEKLDTLSMGMSADLEAAIAEGATLIRVGTDIFGARQ
ncbi:MAG: YggS family pyridoxal phosphate-dependent enzyme [Porticoccaceae bacterium]